MPSAVSGRPWTPEEDEILRERYFGTKAEVLAAELGRGLSALQQRARKLGLRSGRLVSADEERRFRKLYGKVSAQEVSRRVFGGRKSVSAMVHLAAKLGVQRQIHKWPPAIVERVRGLHARGLTDRQIAAAMGWNHDQAKHVRRVVLKLPLIPDVEGKRRGVAKQCATLGIDGPGGLRRIAWSRWAKSLGWPEDLRPREVQILETLIAAGGPMSRPEIAARCGVDPLTYGTRSQGSMLRSKHATSRRSYLAELAARGLIVVMPRALHVEGHGRNRHLYVPSPAALDIAIRRARKRA